MSVSVRCPGCEVTCTVPPELLGRTGRCNQCGRRIRLATPTAELLDSPAVAIDPLPLDDLGELEPVSDLAPHAPAPKPVEPAKKPAPRANRARIAPAAPRGPSSVLLAALALVGLLGGGAVGAVAVKYLVPPEQPKAEPRAAVEPAPVPAPAPAPPAPQPPDPKPQPPDPKPQPPDPKPAPPKPEWGPLAGPKSAVKLSGPVASMTAGGGGRFIVFQTVAGEVVVYDNQLGRTFWTVNGGKPDDLIAVGRTKLFLGRMKDSQVARFDLATGVAEGAATLQGAVASLKYLALGSASDGPLLVVTRANENSYRMRLIDPIAFTEVAYPVEDPTAPTIRGFPLGVTSPPLWVAAGADGRVLMLGNRFVVRNEDRYKGGLLPNTGSAQHLPTPDGTAFVGTRLYGADGTPLPQAELPPGMARRYIPAASGPFVVSVEYKRTDPSVVKLSLHLGADPKPLGTLPGGEEVAAWAKTDAGWVSKLHHRLIFAPDPGVLMFCPPGADSAQVYPINLSGMLGQAGHDVAFTSTPPAEAHPDRPFTYRATATGALGPITFALEAGPPGMTVTRDGALNWPRPAADRTSHEVTLAATTAGGKKAVQTFRVLMPRKGAVVDEPKGPNPFDPK